MIQTTNKLQKMRLAYSNYGLISENDKFIGISLGYDYCAEHEWGYDNLKRLFGLPKPERSNMGITCRSATKCPYIHFYKGKNKGVNHALLFTGDHYNKPSDEVYYPLVFQNYVKKIKNKIAFGNGSEEHKEPILTAWSDNAFGIAVYGNNETKMLEDFYNEISKSNISLLTANSGVFGGNSLCLFITDRIPDDHIKTLYDTDKKHYDLTDYEELIGMTEIKIKYANGDYNNKNSFLACSANWIDYDNAEERITKKKTMNTEYDIQYWVNGAGVGTENTYGWFTVEEVREWLTTDKKLSEIKKT